MGKGDRRTKRGKIFKGTYGKYRPRKPKNKRALEKLYSVKPIDETKND